MKSTTIRRIATGLLAAVLSVGVMFGTMLTSFAEEEDATAVYASTDYANKSELFDALMQETGDSSVVNVPLPEGYVEGVTVRVKYIVNAKTIADNYSSKSFVMQFPGVDLTFDGSYLAKIGGERVEIQVEKKEPIIVHYRCPKCESEGKSNAYEDSLDKYTHVDGENYICPKCGSTFALSEAGEPQHKEVVPGGLQLIEDNKHPVVGAYVFTLNVFSDGKAISDYSDGITASIKATPEALTAAKAEKSNVKFNVYAYLGQSSTYDNMGAKIDEAAGTANFTVQDRGWFFLAADDPGDVEGKTIEKLLPIIIIAAVVVVAVIVVLVVLGKKKGKKADAPAAE